MEMETSSAETPAAVPELTFNAPAGTDAAVAEAPAVEAAPVRRRGKLDKNGIAIGTGRRKTSVARVRLKPGNGAVAINGRTLNDFFRLERDRLVVESPLRATDMLDKVDVWVRVEGGGTTGQAGAILLGISRALEALNPSFHPPLGEGGFLTRDPRMVERKKYGFKKARRSFQFSKR
jgi:small subunit ribosomal protein S9